MVCIYYKKAYDKVLQIWIINCLKMFKILNEDINFIKKTMKKWRVELTAGGRILAEAKIQRGTFQGHPLSPLAFIIVMMPLPYILRKCTAGYRLSRLQEKINHLMYLDDIEIFAKKTKKKTGRTNTQNIQSRYRNRIWHRKMCHASNPVWHTTFDWRNRPTKSRQD